MRTISNTGILLKLVLLSVLSVAVSLAAGFSQNYTLMAISVIIFVGLGVIVTKSISKPIINLANKADSITASSLGLQIDDSSKNEIGILAKSLNNMVRRIQDELAMLKSIQLSIESPFFMADKNTILTFVNKSACELMTVSSDEVVGKMTVKELFGSETATRSALAGKPMDAYEVNIKNHKDETIPVIASSGPIRNANGEIVGAFLTFIDLRRNIKKQREYLEQQVAPIAKAVLAVASGDLTTSVEIGEDSQLYDLGKEVQKMIDDLRLTLQRVSETSSSVASASAQISSSTEELAAGAQEQSAQAGEVAAAVEEMTRTVIENSKNATNTADVAKKNGQVAKEGGIVVEKTIKKIRDIAEVVQKSASTVERLGSSTQEIGEIISVIDDIADQTNLLALNAAIEAARAGEEGRGFAVVADEVRKLAERTTQATKQIASMIKNVQAEATEAVSSMKRGNDEVAEGIRLADKAGESLKNIVQNTQAAIDMMMQIAAASEEQSSTSEQISKNVESISTVSTESANGISQIARAADDLNRLTENLQNLILNFKIEKKENEKQAIIGASLSFARQPKRNAGLSGLSSKAN